VARAEEGALLRGALGPGPAIHVFAGLMDGDAALAREFDLVPCLDSAGQMRAFADRCPGRPCALQLDSGMNRLGLEPAELAAAADLMPRLAPVLAVSHLACADEPGHPMNSAQRAAFAAASAALPGVRLSLAATGGTLLGPDFHFGMTRPGIGLYGGLPFADARPVVTLALPVIQVRDVAPGEAVGYGAAWVAERPSRIATVAAGYADGLPRALCGRGLALRAGDTPCPIVGRVSMDLITVDVTDLAEVPDRLSILDDQQTVDTLAAAAGTIGYEILTSLGARYDRVYKGSA
jgi:alanine racemase